MSNSAFASGSADHGILSGLADDDHTQYVALNGRAGGQTIIGDTAASGNLIIRATSSATNGDIIFQSDGSATEQMRIGSTGIITLANPSTTTTLRFMEPSGGANYTQIAAAAQSTNVTLTLPTAVAGVADAPLVSTTGGVLSWLNAQSKANPGYIKIPGGIYIQFGSTGTNGSGVATISFATSFPTSGITIVGMDRNDATRTYKDGFSLSTSGATLTCSAAVSTTVAWIAVGY